MILDASIIVAWFLPDEPHGDRALEVRERALAGDGRAVVPGICWTEVSHALVRAFRRGRLPMTAVDITARAIDELRALVPVVAVDPVDAMRAAIDLHTGVYDATYLVLARSRREPLVTLDRRLADAGIAAAIDVIWLGDVDGGAASPAAGSQGAQ